MSRNIIVLAITSFLLISSFAFSDEPNYVPREVIVQFVPQEEDAYMQGVEIESLVAFVCGGTVEGMSEFVLGLTLVEIPDDMSVEEAIVEFENTPGVLYAQPNYIHRYVSAFPNDPYFPYLYGLHNTGQTGGTLDADIDAPEAWDLRTDACNVIVAVIDSGVDYTHPDLAANMWRNPGEIPGNGIDDDNNGYIDDIYGYDFYNNDGDPMDDLGHGTHCAGIIGAVGNNAQGVTGVCWNVKIMALKNGNINGIPTYCCIQCIYYAIAMGAKVLSNSWGGGPYEQGLKDAIDAANAAGVLFVAAAGNDGMSNDYRPFYPASYDCNNIIAVMATDANDERSTWPPYGSSNYGPTSVDLAAPGSDILSCILGGGYEYHGGTSMAAPYVAGACALLWSYKPYLTYNQVKDGILETVDKLPALESDPDYGRLCLTGGRLNLYKALLYKPHLFALTKQDSIPDGNCVLPGALITYTITYNANGHGDSNVRIMDYLPQEVTYDVNYDPNTGEWDQNYSPANHTYTWELGTVPPDGNGTFTLIVQVNNLAEPCGVITNRCEIEGDHSRSYAETSFSVCAWNPGVVYVDIDATGGRNTGMSWQNAYLDLQYALDRANKGCGSEIWVAAGTYKPSVPALQTTFQLVAGIPVYGHFAGNETSLGQRNLKNLDNETILSGDNYRFFDVVTASNLIQGATLDGFTIKDAYNSAIKIEKANLVVKNCHITGIRGYGIYANKSGFTISDCIIQESNGVNQPTYVSGIYSNFDNNTALPEIRITNNIIRNNVHYNGIYLDNIRSRALVANNRIHNNDNSGIYVHISHSPNLTIQNNTIVNNGNYGIIGIGVYANPNPAPIVRNCIIWGNEPNEVWWAYNPTFSCIKGGYTGTGNISSDPCFTYPDNNDFHLDPNSLCIDAGDPCFNDFNDRDIDGECRILFGKTDLRVDMGADEFYWHKADFDKNDIVNFIDFAMLSNSWETTVGESDYNDLYDLEDDNVIDIYDLAQFCDDWLWIAPWSPLYQSLGSQPEGGDMGINSEGTSESVGLADEMCAAAAIEESAASDNVTEIEPITVEDMVDWLDDIWQTGELTMNEQEYLEFRSTLLKSAE